MHIWSDVMEESTVGDSIRSKIAKSNTSRFVKTDSVSEEDMEDDLNNPDEDTQIFEDDGEDVIF